MTETPGPANTRPDKAVATSAPSFKAARPMRPRLRTAALFPR